MTFFHKLISFQVFDLFLHNLVYLFLVPVPTRVSAHARSHVWFTWGGGKQYWLTRVVRSGHVPRARALYNVFAWLFGVFFTWSSKFLCVYDIISIIEGERTWDRVSGCVFESVYIFRNMKRNSVFNQETPRVSHLVPYLSVLLPPFKTGCIMCVCVKERHNYLKEWQRENERQWGRANASERREGERERKELLREIYIASSFRSMSEPLSSPPHSHDILRRMQFFCWWNVKIGQADLRINCDCQNLSPGPVPTSK